MLLLAVVGVFPGEPLLAVVDFAAAAIIAALLRFLAFFDPFFRRTTRGDDATPSPPTFRALLLSVDVSTMGFRTPLRLDVAPPPLDDVMGTVAVEVALLPPPRSSLVIFERPRRLSFTPPSSYGLSMSRV